MSKQRGKSKIEVNASHYSHVDVDSDSRYLSLTSPRTLISIGVMLTSITAIYLIWFTHAFHNELHNGVANAPQSTTNNVVISSPTINEPKIINSPPHEVLKVDRKEPVFLQQFDTGDASRKQEIEQENSILAPVSHIISGKSQNSGRYVNPIDLPGAKSHQILTLPIDTLTNTPVDQLMSFYGEAEGGPSCGADYGNTLIKRWRDTKTSNCKPTEDGNAKLKSQIDCYLMHQNHHHGNGDNLCVMENVAMNLGIFGDNHFTSPIIDHYVATRHADQPYPKFPQGFITGDCHVQKEHWQSRVMPGWNADLTTGAFRHIGELRNADQVQCDTWIEHPVLMQERDTFANFFHDSEDFVNVFLAMAVLQWKPKDTQIFLMDLYPEGPFWNMWKEVYSHDYPAYSAFDLKTHYGVPSGQSNYVCFRKLAMGIYGPAAPTTICSWDHPCKKTALVRAYSDFVIRTLDLQHMTHYAAARPSKEVVITYMSRRPSKEWPEKKYCDDDHSFFRCQLWANFGPRSLGRMIRNDQEVINALISLQNEKFSNGAVVKITAVDFNVLSFKEQITVDLQTDIMVGPHGAGLMHNIFMRDRASLIELFVDGSSANRHFHNLAGWYGRKYEGVGMSNPVNINELLRIVRRHIESMDLNSY